GSASSAWWANCGRHAPRMILGAVSTSSLFFSVAATSISVSTPKPTSVSSSRTRATVCSEGAATVVARANSGIGTTSRYVGAYVFILRNPTGGCDIPLSGASWWFFGAFPRQTTENPPTRRSLGPDILHTVEEELGEPAGGVAVAGVVRGKWAAWATSYFQVSVADLDS